ncbi:MAG TPA: phasin family protein [Aliidongia sp.]|uniref:phasin family protein n=1 Tax=Aliidongia sp. TaxID=1914230 RepID=UPI002DDD1EAE|nr:phasin family protein [Aliidongia sp.]HEV2676451.1 phasin family protein [Aliidongia sp.]
MAKAIPTAAAPDTLERSMNETSAGFAATARAMSETVTAAGTVIGHRVALGAQAAADPFNTAHHAEFSLMTSEKVAAFSDASAVMMDELQDLNREVMKFVAQQTVGTAQAVFALGSASTPSAMFEVQQRFLMESWARGSAHAFKLAALSSGASALVLAPVHSAATANAKRLTKDARKKS